MALDVKPLNIPGVLMPQVKGWSGITEEYFTNSKGLLKTIATVFNTVEIFIKDSWVSAGAREFGRAGGVVGSLPYAIAEICHSVRKFAAKKWVDASAGLSKGVGELVGLVGWLQKGQVIQLSLKMLQPFIVVKHALTVVGDSLHVISSVLKGKKVVNLCGCNLESAAFWTGFVKAICALAFHIILALGAVFFYPIAPAFVVSAAIVYTLAVTINHFVSGHKDDSDKRALIAQYNLVGISN